MINNRQNGRRRGRGGQRPGGGGGGNPGQPSGSRIDNRARGNASQLYEKYKTLARDAQMQGDRVNTEYYLQFADHYFRVLSENRPRDEQRVRQRDDFDDDFDGNDGEEFGNEGEPVRADQYQPRADRPRDDQRDERRPQRAENGRSEGARPEAPRPETAHAETNRTDGNRGERGPRPERDDRRPRHAQAGEVSRRDTAEANGHAIEPVATMQPDPALEEASPPHLADMEAPQPRRRGRPRRERPVEDAGADAPAETFEADRLPPSLSVSASAEPDTAAPEDAQAEKPRRRRRVATPAEVTSAN